MFADLEEYLPFERPVHLRDQRVGRKHKAHPGNLAQTAVARHVGTPSRAAD